MIAVLVLTGVIQADNLATIVIAVTVVAAVAYFAVILGSRRIDATERSRVWGSCRCSSRASRSGRCTSSSSRC